MTAAGSSMQCTVVKDATPILRKLSKENHILHLETRRKKHLRVLLIVTALLQTDNLQAAGRFMCQ